MYSEFLMPVKYQGSGCGISASVFGLDESCVYDSIVISVGSENREVAAGKDSTAAATFDNLRENHYYTVTARITSGGETRSIECIAVPSVRKSMRIAARQHRSFAGLQRRGL